jgi:glucose-6-phosphate 1-dehydrogenase
MAFVAPSIYPMEHYLGKDGSRSLLTARADPFWKQILNREEVSAVELHAPENDLVGRRGFYYDASGVLHDMVQGHLLEVLSLLLLEIPQWTLEGLQHEYRWDTAPGLRLEALRSLRVHDVVLGQYRGYLNEPGVKAGSCTPTSAAVLLYSSMPRWKDVPIIVKTLKAGPCKNGYLVFHQRHPGGDDAYFVRSISNPDDSIKTKYGRNSNGYESVLRSAIMAERKGPWTPSPDEDLVCAELVQEMEACAVGPPYPYEIGSWGPRQAVRIARVAGLTGFTQVTQES